MGSEDRKVAALLRAMAAHPDFRRVVMKAAKGYREVQPMLEAVKAGPCECEKCIAKLTSTK